MTTRFTKRAGLVGWMGTALLTLSITGFGAAAEPEVDAKDLPRVPATEPANVGRGFAIRPGFRMELTAAEPLVYSPVAMSFDEEGRLYVIEMRDYSERRPERLGRVRRLVDTDGDGKFDQSTVFADNLPWPTAVFCYGGGVFVGATPDVMFFKDDNGDGVADRKEVVFTGFASDFAPYETNKLNVQALLNTFQWGLDNRIHLATGGSGGKVKSLKNPGAAVVDVRGRDFSFDPRTFEMRAESGGAQHGMSFDDFGNKYVCSNSDHIQQVMYEDRYAGRNPWFAPKGPRISIAADGPAAEVYRTSPDEPWRVLRTQWRVAGLVPGLIEGGGRPSGYFTAATGVTIYRGDALPESIRGNAFVADCGSNLIHRKQLLRDRLVRTAKRPPGEERMEFLTSTDNWFRPVQFANAPDGALYVADMYRETIEHPWSFPASLKKHLDLNSGNDRGRIYRLVPEEFVQPKPVRLGGMNPRQLVALLEHSNAWHRDAAARLLYERQDKTVQRDLEKLLEKSTKPKARLHALYTLSGLGLLQDKTVFLALADGDAEVRRHAVRLCETLPVLNAKQRGGETVETRLTKLANDPEPSVRYQMAFTLGSIPHPERVALLASIALHDAQDPWFRLAILTSLKEGAAELFTLSAPDRALAATGGGREFVRQLGQVIGARNQIAEIERAATLVASQADVGEVFGVSDALWTGAEGAGADRDRLFAVFKPVRDRARTAVGDKSLAEPVRLGAIRVAARGPSEEFQKPLGDLLNPEQTEEVQSAALTALASLPKAAGVPGVLAGWKQLTPRQRQSFLDAVLKRSEGVSRVGEALEKDVLVRTDFTAAQWERLSRSNDERARAGVTHATRNLATAGNRAEVLARYLPALQLAGEAGRGKAIFLQRCLACHRAGGEGGNVGPDLASVQSNGKEVLLRNLIDPNLAVAPQFAAYEVVRKNDETLVGIIVSEGDTSITLRGADAKDVTLPRSQIQTLRGLGRSLMPEGLEEGLSSAEMADLLEYLTHAN